jgi:hypothetical protein
VSVIVSISTTFFASHDCALSERRTNDREIVRARLVKKQDVCLVDGIGAMMVVALSN